VLDNTGHLLVVDSANGRVIQVDGSGNLLDKWTIEDQQVRSIVLGEPGIAWLSDGSGAKVIRLDMTHGYVTTLPVGGKPAGLARDPYTGNMWVADSERNQIIRIDRITPPSDAAPQPSDFSTRIRTPVGDAPMSVAIDDKMIWVANADSDSVTVRSYKKPYDRLADDFQIPGRPVAITAAGTRAWVVSQLGGAVAELTATPR
jgi:DNA-binding beta-propeller fold protein YncE